MPPQPSPAPSSLPARPSPAGLRKVPGGYDLDTLPIRVDVHDGESPVSWLRRLSARYDTPARDLLKVAGARKPVTGTSRVAGRLRNYPGIPQRLGLSADQVRHLVNPKPLAAATTTYIDTFHRGEAPVRSQSRYCPHCLTGLDPHWPDHWQSPLSLICLTHHSYLLRTCPDCRQPPQATPAWLTWPVELHRCPSRRGYPGGGGARRLLPWCNGDLTTAATIAAPRGEVRAQQLLHDWAVGTAEPGTACGLAITHRIGFQALAELAHAALGQNSGLLDVASDSAKLGPGLAAAVHVLDQPNLDGAAHAAGWMLSYNGPHAPVAPARRIERHHYSPLLAAIQLHGVRDQLPAAQQLTFRTGHPAPRYPVVSTPKNQRRLRLPGHRPNLPEPEPAWIPQTLWWNAIPAVFVGCPDPALCASALAMALARVGTTREWADICTDLHLPTSHANRIGGLILHARRTGTWPAALTGLERLMTGLQQHPPPINYQARRNLGEDLDLISQAIHAGRRRHPSTVPVEVLVRQFWERFTGGDIVYAPLPIRIDPSSAAHATFRRTSGVASADLFHVAHRHLTQTTGAKGPLTWRPGPLTSST